MFLGVDELLKLVEKKKLVEGLCKRELEYPEGTGFDLRLGEVYQIKGEGFLGVEERETPKVELVAKFSRGRRRKVEIKPRSFYLVKTVERVNVPGDLVGIFKPRTTLHRMGLWLRTSQVNPGYRGELVFGMTNLGPAKVKIELGARIVHVMFARVEGRTGLYRGQWQGGRVTTEKREKQV
jgi:deoxycytidine triphosphate deaminase